MRLKYKKIILIITMSTMGIGFVTLSIGNTNKSNAGNNKPKQVVTEDKKSKEEPKDDGDLKENAHKEVNELINKFLKARSSSDIETMEGIISKTHPYTIEGLQKESQFIERYDNISCYTINGPESGSYVVYIYEELKLVGIDTLAPGLTRVYVCSDENGKLYINFGKVDDETQKFIEDTTTNQQVLDLIARVNKKLEEACTKDSVLKEFMVKLENEKSSK